MGGLKFESLEDIASRYDHVLLDCCAFGLSISTRYSRTKHASDPQRMVDRLNIFREVIFDEDNFLIIDPVREEINKMIKFIKVKRKKTKARFLKFSRGRRKSNVVSVFSDEIRNYDLACKILYSINNRAVVKDNMPEINEEVLNSLMKIVDGAAKYTAEIEGRDIRKENSNTDESLIAIAYAISFDRREKVAILTDDRGITVVSNNVRRFLSLPDLEVYNSDIIDILSDNPVPIYIGDNGNKECLFARMGLPKLSERILNNDCYEIKSVLFREVKKLSKIIDGGRLSFEHEMLPLTEKDKKEIEKYRRETYGTS